MQLPTHSPDLPADLKCPHCDGHKLHKCGDLLSGQPHQRLLVACVECERVFGYTSVRPALARREARRSTDVGQLGLLFA
jgi:hypothetical protein